MCLHPLIVYQIPEETERVARAAFPKGNLYMRIYEQLGPSSPTPCLLNSSPNVASLPIALPDWLLC